MRGFVRPFQRQRKRIAQKLGNPRLNQITFHTFRHWKATMEAHKTKGILCGMKFLGHKSIKNTLVYTQLVTFENDELTCEAATNVKEASELIEAGYEYVCDMEHVKLFRKRGESIGLCLEARGMGFESTDSWRCLPKSRVVHGFVSIDIRKT